MRNNDVLNMKFKKHDKYANINTLIYENQKTIREIAETMKNEITNNMIKL